MMSVPSVDRSSSVCLWPYTNSLVSPVGVGLGGLLLRSGLWRARDPELSIFEYPSTSAERQAACDAQGYLQLLARFPSDPYTVFDLLNLDPSARPFSPSRNSHWEVSKWHQELQDTDDKRYTELMEAISQDDLLGDNPREQYKAALTAASKLLSEHGLRRFYVDGVLPALKQAVHGQPPRCVWPPVREFHRDLCADTWTTTGMMTLLRDRDRLGSFNSKCSDPSWASFFSRWLPWLRR